MLVALSLGVLVGLGALVAMAVLFLAAAAALVRFLRQVEEEPPALALAVTREIGRPATRAELSRAGDARPRLSPAGLSRGRGSVASRPSL